MRIEITKEQYEAYREEGNPEGFQREMECRYFLVQQKAVAAAPVKKRRRNKMVRYPTSILTIRNGWSRERMSERLVNTAVAVGKYLGPLPAGDPRRASRAVTLAVAASLNLPEGQVSSAIGELVNKGVVLVDA